METQAETLGDKVTTQMDPPVTVGNTVHARDAFQIAFGKYIADMAWERAG